MLDHNKYYVGIENLDQKSVCVRNTNNWSFETEERAFAQFIHHLVRIIVENKNIIIG